MYKFDIALNCLIDISEEKQEDYRKIYRGNIKMWIKEFCTIKASAGRGSGHTTSAINTMIDRFEKSVFVTKTHIMKNLAYEIYCKKIINKSKDLFFTISDIKGEKSIGISGLNSVFVDVASVFSQGEINLIYDRFIPCMDFNKKVFFIFVG